MQWDEIHSFAMAKTKHIKHRYYSMEEEEEAIRKMEEKKRKKTEEEETGDSQEEARQTKSAEPPPKKKKRKKTEEEETGDSQEDTRQTESTEPPPKNKKKKDKTSIKSMTKEERQKRSKELKAQRKEMALEKKKAKIEADKVKALLKWEEHRILLEKTHALFRKHTPSAAAGSASEAAASADQPEPPQEIPAGDVLETSLVESGGPLNLNPFPSEEEDEDELPGVLHFRRSTVHTETVSQVTTEAYIQTPAEDAPATTSKAKAAKKVPKKVPSKSRPRPGTGALNYTPSEKDIRKAQQAGDILLVGEKTPRRRYNTTRRGQTCSSGSYLSSGW